ncbi:hypothetical protein C2S52_017122 [Perilla frutescens var. hirtella]|nr:hypothetical protein C2S52_017122 [Perilla frutescens var. hirtella]KAH6810922.1 hypothetical protein C2S51_024684 [Perilla frutescens var. frutescens]
MATPVALERHQYICSINLSVPECPGTEAQLGNSLILDKMVEFGDLVGEEEGCSTPKHGIPARTAPPPPPRKKPGKTKSPKKGYLYFQPPDLDQLFAVRPIPEACV